LVLCLIQQVNKSTAVEKAILLFLAAVLFYAAANKLWQFSLPATALNLSSGTAVLIAMIEISVGTAKYWTTDWSPLVGKCGSFWLFLYFLGTYCN
jgi:hypothetical protein